MSIHHRKSRSGGSYIISNMDSPGKSGDEKILKKNASSSFAAGGNKDGDNLVTLASAPSINLNNKEVEKGDRPSRRKKKRSISHRRAPVSPEGPFPKGAAEIHPSELEYDPADEATIIGKGMYGTVYEGRCRGLRVAIKVLNDQKMDAKSLRKFKDEVELMAGLNHTRVVLFLGACMLENGKVACVTEYLPNGNLETVLESKDIHLTMLDKLKYARDIALGCNWLHHSNPLIIHRDLKPSNLLLDDNGRVKVCDFGLSLAQPEHSKGFRSSRIVGTPLYTSPETIKGKTITTKADVYSYGVVLWQILTRLEPFLECEDSDEVYEVVKKGQRPPLTMPPLPAETTPALRQLVADCWQNSPRKRPSFDEILTRLEVMLIEYAIPDPHGAELWKSRFLGKDEVSWPKFVSTFAEDDRFGAATISPHSPPVRCLKNLLATEASPTAVVTLKSFGDFCSWFGPLVPGVHDEQINITKKIVAILRCPWFHASVTNKQARSMLVQQPIGTFLVRYNESVRGGWIISYVAESSEEGSSGSLNDHYRKGRKSINEKAALEGGAGANEKDDGNGVKRGRIKHVRIYFDKSQPDLGYQLLLPAKPKALQDQPSPHAQPSPTTVDSEALSDIHGSSSSSSLNESGGATGMGEAFKRYVWSSYTTYIVDFINQLLDKNWPGREYLDINYPCPGSRFASIFAQSSPGEESSDSVLGGSVLVRYLNSMTSVDDLKRDKQKDKQPEQQQPAKGSAIAAVVGIAASPRTDNIGKERKAQQQQNGGGGDGGAETNGAKRPHHVEKKKAKKDDHGKAERKKERARLREQQQKENERTATTTTTTTTTSMTDNSDQHTNGHTTTKEEAQKKKERKKEKKEKVANKKESNRERSKSKPEKVKKSGVVVVVEEKAEKARPKTIHQILVERDKEVKERKEKRAEKANKDEKDAKEKEKGSKRLKRSKKTDNKESEKESTTSVATTDASESKTTTPPKKKKKKGSKKKEKESKEEEKKKSEGEGKEEKEREKEKGSKKEKKEKRVSRRLRRTAEDTVTASLTTTSPSKAAAGATTPSKLATSPSKAALKKEKKEKDKLAKKEKEKEKLLNGHNGA